MERRLIVMRHAKSSWDSSVQSDHERPLNDRGLRDAPRVGAALTQLGWIPDLVLSSGAQRTRETFAGLSKSFPREVEARFLNSFYHAGLGAVQDELPAVPDEVSCLLVLGHNPGWEDLVRWLTRKDIMMKTSTAALLTRDLPSWKSAVDAGSWNLDRVLYARELVD